VTSKRAITSLRVRNFKAVHDSGTLTPGGFTVFIGNNGTGKSSVIEALRFLRSLSRSTLDQALKEFGSYADLRWKGGANRGQISPSDPDKELHPIELTVSGHLNAGVHRASVRISGLNQSKVGFDHETLRRGATTLTRTRADEHDLRPEQSLLSRTRYFDDWQYLDLAPQAMGRVEQLSGVEPRGHLEADGSNLGEYLLSLQQAEGGEAAFERLQQTLQRVLPYSRSLKTEVTKMLGQRVALTLGEELSPKERFEVPGWMLSTGTMRLVALLAVLRHPKPPSLLCVEEIENGLDPRTVMMVLAEIRRATEAGRMQVMVTTHSPYLLDQVPLESIVLVTRDEGQSPRFTRPAESAVVHEWAKQFAPGQLYVSGTLRRPVDEAPTVAPRRGRK